MFYKSARSITNIILRTRLISKSITGILRLIFFASDVINQDDHGEGNLKADINKLFCKNICKK